MKLSPAMIATSLPEPVTRHGVFFYASVLILVALAVWIGSLALKNIFWIADKEVDRFRERRERNVRAGRPTGEKTTKEKKS